MRLVAAIYLIFFFLLHSTSMVTAQNQCGQGLPCGPVPWPIPQLPELASPSPFPTIEITSTPSPTPGATPTPTNTLTPSPTATIPTPTTFPSPTSFLDTTEIFEQMGTIQAIANATTVPIEEDPGDINSEMGTNAGTFFAYIRGLSEANFGVLSPLVVFMLTSFTFVLVVKAAQLFMPMVSVGFGFLRKIVEFVLEFIPG